MDPSSSPPLIDGHKAAVAQVGRPQTRIDGPLKVCGLAEYPGDVQLPGMAHAALAVSAIASGRVTTIRREDAMAMPGVLLVLTHEDVGEAIDPVGHLMQGGWATGAGARSPRLRSAMRARSSRWWWPKRRRLAAGVAALTSGYAGQSPIATLGDPRCPPERLADVSKERHDRRKGDLDTALATAAVQVDNRYSTPDPAP